jgi:exopolysaccharide biosynthesis predicted pyruvyltransferase EpsI
VHDPVEHIASRLGPGGRCLFLPNGGNLGDNLIAAATIQRLERAGVPWDFIRGRRREVISSDVLAFGGGGSLVPQYQGGIECVRSLIGLGAPVVVLPQSCSGHEAFWRSVGEVTVFCRDAQSLRHMQRFAEVRALPAHDMAIGLDLSQDPFSAVRQLREAIAQRSERRSLSAFRGDLESARPHAPDSLDVSVLADPPLATVASIYALACTFLAAIAVHSEVRTDRLHVAIAAGLLGIPTILSDTRFGKNRAVHEASLQRRFECITLAAD